MERKGHRTCSHPRMSDGAAIKRRLGRRGVGRSGIGAFAAAPTRTVQAVAASALVIGFALTAPLLAATRTSYPGNLSKTLDLPLLGRGSNAEIDMLPGRLNKLPVSWIYQTSLVVAPGAQGLRVRTTGCSGTSDTGLLATWRDVPLRYYTAFDNDGNAGSGNGKCSSLTLPPPSNPLATTYTLYAFSMTRATSSATLQFSLDAGATWTPITTDQFGGSVVRVGALQVGDTLEVQTPTDGAGDEATTLVLFEPPAVGASIVPRLARLSAAASTTDRDPRITMTSAWPSLQNAVIVGKTTRRTTALRGVEIPVDLVRGPLDANRRDVPIACVSGTCASQSTVLLPGRYYVSLFASADEPTGSLTPGNEHFAYEMSTDEYHACPAYPRGRANDQAFRVELRKDAEIVEDRVVPRALLGTDRGLGYNRIIFDVDADGTTAWRLVVRSPASDITFFPSVRFERNPEVNQLKISSWNFANWAADKDSAPRTAIVQNAADILGTRGDIVASLLQVNEPVNQAPWQWESDVLAFQEFYSSTSQPLISRLRARTPYSWSFINANTEISDVVVLGGFVFYGPVFVNSLFSSSLGPKFSNLQMDDGVSPNRCNSRWDGSAYDFACPLGEVDNRSFNYYNRAVPAKLVAKRAVGQNPGTNRPVAFFNWHLYFEDERADARAVNIEEMIKHIKYLMSRPADGTYPAGACAFNKECGNDPKHYANRIVIVGDTNMRNHLCGEYTWAIRRLREEFGYAVDVASATLDSQNRPFDLHYSGGLVPAGTSAWGSCQQTNGPWSKTTNADGTRTGCPFHFQEKTDWTADTPKDFSASSWFPWWAATAQDIDGADIGGSRWDVVFLVGRGWAYDDPIVSYKVLPHQDPPSVMSGGSGGGIETGYDYQTCLIGRVRNGGGNYAPKVSVNGCGTGEGAPALRSDHVPIGVKLRIWGR